MMLTSWPAARSASASCQTRRSKGQGRFSTMMRIRHLPGDAFIGSQVCAARACVRAPCTDQIDDGLAQRELLQQCGKFPVCRCDHQHFRLLDQLLGPIDHESTYMRDVIQNVVAICSDETRESHVP